VGIIPNEGDNHRYRLLHEGYEEYVEGYEGQSFLWHNNMFLDIDNHVTWRKSDYIHDIVVYSSPHEGDVVDTVNNVEFPVD